MCMMWKDACIPNRMLISLDPICLGDDGGGRVELASWLRGEVESSEACGTPLPRAFTGSRTHQSLRASLLSANT